MAIALPWLEVMAPERPARAADAPAKRFVGIYTPGGTVLENATDAKGPFKSAIDLLQRIAESDDAKACTVSRWLGQAYRREAAPEDACAKAELTKAFLESDGKLVDLLVALGTSDNFRYRLKSELTP